MDRLVNTIYTKKFYIGHTHTYTYTLHLRLKGLAIDNLYTFDSERKCYEVF